MNAEDMTPDDRPPAWVAHEFYKDRHVAAIVIALMIIVLNAFYVGDMLLSVATSITLIYGATGVSHTRRQFWLATHPKAARFLR